MIGDHQRASHSALRGMTASPYLSSSGRVGLVPERPLPARRLEEHRTELALVRVHRAQPHVPVRGPLLARVHDAVRLVERLAGARAHVLAGALRRVEAGDVRGVRVDLGRALDHPLRDGAADAGALLDPHGGCRPQTLDVRRLTEDRGAVRGEREQAVDRVPDAHRGVAQDVRHELERLLELQVEVVGGERQLGGRQRRLLDRRDLLGVVQDRPVRVRADLHVAAVLALVAERVHVADDRELDLADGVRELRDRADADHLVHRRGERDAARRPSRPASGSTRRRR